MITKLGKSLCKMLPLLLGSLAAGAINGLFGMGGGIVIYFILSRLYAQSDEYDAKDIFAMTVISVLIMSLSSVFLYFSSGAFSLSLYASRRHGRYRGCFHPLVYKSFSAQKNFCRHHGLWRHIPDFSQIGGSHA